MLGDLVRIISGEFRGHLARIVGGSEKQVTVKLIGESRRRDFFKEDVEVL